MIPAEMKEILISVSSKLPEVLLIFFGFVLGTIPSWLRRKQKIKNHWANLYVELVTCRDKAETYLTDNIQCPLYRFPTAAFQLSLPDLISFGQLTEYEINILSRYASQVQNLNRGLENSAKLRLTGTPTAMNIIKEEFKRNCLYAKDLVTHTGQDKANFYNLSLSIIEKNKKKKRKKGTKLINVMRWLRLK